ncbi:hypothetical protein ACFFTK_09035 [Pseudonocardia petroleophila]|uniref:Uncharacterized protein n=1 Tax=Pseudonocardia petroleophila TaxID=37331 RepID=A0A7G7MFT3_9PSEU|nr:hypothetical protein [Pseudonocardia petroleophila]QNG51644.1 hypothetical protein H6H00_26650 [Pseudonocardia petroleophila]
MTESIESDTPSTSSNLDDNGRFAVLRSLLAVLGESDTSLSVTLFVDGAVVTGRAVPRTEWLEAVAGVPSPDDDPTADGIRTLLRGAADVDSEPLSSTTINTVNLIDVTIFSVGGAQMLIPTLQIALARVSGWTLGRVEFQR